MTPEQIAKSGSEAGNQRALFAWANMAERYGVSASMHDASYNQQGWAEDHMKYAVATGNCIGPLKQLHWLHAIKNQEKGGGDKKTNAIRGLANKAEGVKPGVADVFLPYAVALYATNPKNTSFDWCHGLYIEMKKPKDGKVGPKQEQFRNYCLANSYAHYYCYTWQEARTAILSYLGLA